MTTTVLTTEDLIENLTANGWEAKRVPLGGNTEGIEIRSASVPGSYVLATDYYGSRCPLDTETVGLLVNAYTDTTGDTDPLSAALDEYDGTDTAHVVASLSSALHIWVNG